MSRKQATVIDAAIAANLVALAQRLEEATTVAREASSAMANSYYAGLVRMLKRFKTDLR
jgi:hypothetical protein